MQLSKIMPMGREPFRRIPLGYRSPRLATVSSIWRVWRAKPVAAIL
jgi:hypothetical protein